MSKTGIAVAAVLTLIAMIVLIACVATREADKLDAIVDQAVQFLSIPLMVVAVAVAFTALRGGDAVAPAIVVAAVALLGVSLIHGFGAWGTPLALAACVIAALWVRRTGEPGAA